jgi:hypothetical protein
VGRGGQGIEGKEQSSVGKLGIIILRGVRIEGRRVGEYCIRGVCSKIEIQE